jgi:hypothetical protein
MKPILQAILLADHVYSDVSGKKVIAGTFNAVTKAKLTVSKLELADGTKRQLIPGGTHPGCPWIYISLTDVVDNTKVTLQFVNVSKNKLRFGMELAIKCNDRFAVVEITQPLPPHDKLFPESGVYSLDLLWEGEIIGSHRIVVSDYRPEGPQESPGEERHDS